MTADTEPRDPLALTQENLDWAHDRIGTLTERCETLSRHAERLAEAIRLTREYIDGGTGERLPAIEGWSWFDALHAHDELFGTTYAKHALESSDAH